MSNEFGIMLQVSAKNIEKLEEAKLKAKYPLAGGAGHSAFLQKKLAKGVITFY